MPLLKNGLFFLVLTLILIRVVKWYLRGLKVRGDLVRQRKGTRLRDGDPDAHEIELPPVVNTEGMAEVSAKLDAMQLGTYVPRFQAHGYDDWSEITGMGEVRLSRLVERVGFTSNHADRFREQLYVELAGGSTRDVKSVEAATIDMEE